MDPEKRLPSPVASLKQTSRLARLHTFIGQSVTTTYTEYLLLLCFLCTGLIDAAGFNAWSTFLNGQSGNTIFLALGASGQPISAPDAWIKSLMSILCFGLGCFVFPRALRPLGYQRCSRGSLAVSLSVQSLFVVMAGCLVATEIIPVPWRLKGVPEAQSVADLRPGDRRLDELAGIALLAFQAGGQVTLSRVLPFPELPTVVLTTCYCDLWGDPKLFKPNNGPRTRRALAPVFVLVGGIASGWIMRSPAGMSTVLWTAAAIKAIMSMAFLCWKADTSESTDNI